MVCWVYSLESSQWDNSNEYTMYVFLPPHRMMPGAYSFSVFHMWVCAYECTSFLSHLLVAGCDIGVRFSVRLSVRQSVRLSTFMSTFDIYVKVSILINYKTKQPSNLAWNISLTSWLCDIGDRFFVCLSIRPSVCQHLCRRSTFMSKLVF